MLIQGLTVAQDGALTASLVDALVVALDMLL